MVQRSKPDTAGWEFTQRVLIVLSLLLLFVIGAWMLYVAARVFAVIFLGLLAAVLLRGIAGLVRRGLGIGRGWALALVCVVMGGALLGGGWFMASKVVYQFDDFVTTLRSAAEQVHGQLQATEWGRQVLSLAPLPQNGGDGGAVAGRITGAFSSALGGLLDIFVIAFLGIYFAADPDRYVQGMLHLLPIRARDRAAEVFDAVGRTLQWWMLGRTANMAIVGGLTGIGLWALGVPMALPLAVTAFLLDFVPYLGPPLSAVPAVLIAATTDGGANLALSVLGLYVAVQFFEGYVTQPLIESRAVEMPPALVIIGQIMLGVLFGVPGVIVASPLMAVLLVVIKMTYVEDVLGDDSVEVKAEQTETPNRKAKRAG